MRRSGATLAALLACVFAAEAATRIEGPPAEQQLLETINRHRRAQSTPARPLRPHEGLSAEAAERVSACAEAAAATWSGRSPDAAFKETMSKAAGGLDIRDAKEIGLVLEGAGGADAAVEKLKADGALWTALMDPKWDLAGVAVARYEKDGRKFEVWAVELVQAPPRQGMTTGAWVMLVVGAVILCGGLTLSMRVAVRGAKAAS